MYKIFGAMSKELSSEICAHFGTGSVENLVANRRNRFINRCGNTDDYFCQIFADPFRLFGCIFYCAFFNFCSLIYSFILCYHIRR